jgi:glycosyltransferase involved in cell wall biosynthesis
MLEKYYSSCDIFVSPSLLEGFGFTVLEALKYGKPVVASRVGAIPEILEKVPNVLLVNGGSSASLSKALNEVLSMGVIQSSILHRNMTKFNWESCAKAVNKVYMSGE